MTCLVVESIFFTRTPGNLRKYLLDQVKVGPVIPMIQTQAGCCLWSTLQGRHAECELRDLSIVGQPVHHMKTVIVKIPARVTGWTFEVLRDPLSLPYSLLSCW